MWFDIDRTAAGLDAMLELVDANGNFSAPLTPVQANGQIVTLTQADPAGSEEFGAFLRADYESVGRLMKAAGIQPE